MYPREVWLLVGGMRPPSSRNQKVKPWYHASIFSFRVMLGEVFERGRMRYSFILLRILACRNLTLPCSECTDVHVWRLWQWGTV